MVCHWSSGISQNFDQVEMPGVGDDDVEPAELVDALAHDGVERCLVTDVGSLADDAPPRRVTASAVSSRSDRSVAITSAPALASARQIPWPRPRAAPVTNATLPSRSVTCTPAPFPVLQSV